jgi:hypothetical protein
MIGFTKYTHISGDARNLVPGITQLIACHQPSSIGASRFNRAMFGEQPGGDHNLPERVRPVDARSKGRAELADATVDPQEILELAERPAFGVSKDVEQNIHGAFDRSRMYGVIVAVDVAERLIQTKGHTLEGTPLVRDAVFERNGRRQSKLERHVESRHSKWPWSELNAGQVVDRERTCSYEAVEPPKSVRRGRHFEHASRIQSKGHQTRDQGEKESLVL